MKSIINSLLIILFFYSSLFSKEEKIRISISQDMVPYTFIEEDNTTSGIFVDFWKLWAKKNNQKIEFVSSSWSDTLENLKNNEADIHSGLFKSNEREEFLTFTNPIYKSKSYLLKKLSFNNATVLPNFELNKWFYAAVKKGNKDLVNLVNEGIKKISHKELAELEKKWLLNNKFLDFENKDKWLDKKTVFTKEELEYIKKSPNKENNSDGIEFTNKELDFIKKKKTISFSSSEVKPISIIKGNKNQGIFKDYLKIIEQRSGLKFKFIKSESWEDAHSKFKEKRIDVIPMGESALSLKNILLSKSLIGFKYAIVSNNEETYIDGLSELRGKIIAVPKGHSSHNLIKKSYPEIKIIITEDVNEALKMVSKNKVDAFVGNSAVSIFHIKNSFPDLRIIGLSDEYLNIHIAVQDKYPELLTILNKVILSITEDEKLRIKDKWIGTEINTAVDYTLLYTVITIFLIVLAIVLYFTKKLASAKKEIENRNKKIEETLIELKNSKEELENSHHELEVSIENLKQTQNHLVESEKMASLGKLVAGVAHEINTPVGVGITASSHLSFASDEIRMKFEDNDMSKEEFKEYLDEVDKLTALISTNLNRTSEFIKNFKDVAVDQTSEQKRVFYLKDYTVGILFSVENIIKKKDINIDINCDETLFIDSYPGLYSQIITNLIINSFRHGFKTKDKGTISIDISLEDKLLKLIYKDDGVGIPKENLSQIYEPFFTTNREDGGTGLGLNIIYNIVKNNLNGTIKCIDTNGNGVEFIIEYSI